MSLSAGQHLYPLRHGTLAVTDSPQNLVPAGSYPAMYGVWIHNPGPEAEIPNVLSVYIGSNSSVVADITAPNGGYELEPGQKILLRVALDTIWLVGSTAGPVYISWLAE
jgi:hypothetical protein